MVYELYLNKTVILQKKKSNCIGMIHQYINSNIILIWWDLFRKNNEASTKFGSIQHVFVVYWTAEFWGFIYVRMYLFIWSHCVACGILAPWPEIEPVPLAVEPEESYPWDQQGILK